SVPVNGLITGTSTRSPPPNVLLKLRQASHHRMLTHTDPAIRHGLGPLSIPCSRTPIPCPWNDTRTFASISASNEKGAKMKIAFTLRVASSVTPDPLARSAKAPPTCTVFEVIAKNPVRVIPGFPFYPRNTVIGCSAGNPGGGENAV